MKRINAIFVCAGILAAALALSARSKFTAPVMPGEMPTRNANAVKIDNFSFGPATLTIPAGTTITWTNMDDVPHVVSSDDNKTFKSKALDTDDHFSYTFTKPGTYNYYCAIHPKMTAKIVVQ